MTHKPNAFQRCKYTEKWLGVILQQLYHHVLMNQHLNNRYVLRWYSLRCTSWCLWFHLESGRKRWTKTNKYTHSYSKICYYLNPWHIMLLHFFHLLLNRCIQFMFKFKGLHVIHISITVEQISLKSSPWSFLCISGCLGFLFIISITVIPVSNICRRISTVFVKKNHTITKI